MVLLVKRKEERKKNYKALFSLYLSFILNKRTIIAILISLSFLIGSLWFISNVEEETEYLANPLSFHQAYFNLALLIIGILNGIIISFLVLNVSINSLSFDLLFVSYIKRTRLSLIKLLTILIIIFMLLTFEFAIIVLISLIKFSMFKITNEFVLSFYFNYIVIIFETLVIAF